MNKDTFTLMFWIGLCILAVVCCIMVATIPLAVIGWAFILVAGLFTEVTATGWWAHVGIGTAVLIVGYVFSR